MNSQNKIAVVAAVLTTRDMQQFFVAERADGLGWEFPGGKLEFGEQPKDALKREIREELGCEIDVQDILGQSEVVSGTRIIIMDAYLAFCDPSQIVLKEHLAGRWITVHQVYELDWAPADIPLLDGVIQYFQPASIQITSSDDNADQSNTR